MKHIYAFRFLFLISMIIAFSSGYAQLSITSNGTNFTTTFDAMASSATATLPTGFKVNGNNSAVDWSTGTTATTLAYGTAGTGLVTGTSSGGTINWANGITASATDRALGFLTTGTYASPNSIILRITNNTGTTIGSISVSFDYEKYRSGTRAYDWTFFHGTASNPTTAASSGNQSYTADANNTVISNPPTSVSKSVSITGLSILNGGTYYFKWTCAGVNGSTNSQGLAIDNVTINTTQIAAPAVTSSLTDNGSTGVPYSYAITASNFPTSFNVSGTLPPGLSLSGNTISGTPTGSGSFTVNISASNATGTDTKSLTINIAAPISLTVLSPAAQSKTYDGTNAAIITGTLSGVVGSDNVSLTGGGTFAQVNVGTGISVTSNLSLTGSDAGKYVLAQPTGLTADINPASQTITFASLPTKSTADGPFTLSATSTSALPVSFSSNNASVATVSGSTITITGAGTAIITASQVGGGNYAAAPNVPQTLVVTNALAAWDFTGAGGYVTSNASFKNTALSVTPVLSRGSTAASSAATNSFRTVGFSNEGISTTNTDYFQTSVTVGAGYLVSLSSIDAYLAGTATYYAGSGVNQQIAYSFDGTSYTLVGSPVNTASATTVTAFAMPQIDLSGISGLQNLPFGTTVYFRYYASGQTTTGGWGFVSPVSGTTGLTISGTVAAAPVPAVALASLHPAAGTTDQGTTDVIIGRLFAQASITDAYLTGLSVTASGSYLATDVTDFKFWINSTNTLSGATQLGTTQTSVANGSTVTVSGLSTIIPNSATRFIFITTSIASNAVTGRTIGVAATSFANINFASANKTGTDPVPASNLQTITQLDPTVAITGVSPAAGNIPQNSINQLLGSIKLDVSITSATLTGVSVTPVGSYLLADLPANSFKFWINSTNSLSGATQLGTTQAAASSGTPVSVSGLSTSISNGATRYILVTTDVMYDAVPGHTISLDDLNLSSISFVSADKTGTNPIAATNTKTISAVAPTITLAGGGPSSAILLAPSASNILYQFNITPAANYAILNQLSLPVTGTVAISDFVSSSVKLFYNTVNTFSTASQIGASISMVNGGGTLVFSNLSQAIPISSTGYFWVSGDIKSTAVAGHTVTVSPLAAANILFSQGTKTGSPTTGGTFTLAPSPTIAEIIVPQFIQGVITTNTNRIPYCYRVKIGNLLPNATYRYYNSVVASSDGMTGTGAGNIIFPNPAGYTQTASPSLTTAGGYGTFTTNASGDYTGWFITEPTANATRFIVGTNVNFRIMLNDGNNGTTVASRVTTTSTATVINFATTSAVGSGSALRGSSSASAKNIVLLYDNIAGTGRPITAAIVESDGLASTNYPSFYTTFVNGVAGAWGTIIPNILPNGIRRIEQRDLSTGNLLNCPAISTNGSWFNSGINTVNPTNGTSTILAISSTDAPLNSSVSTWLGITSNWNTATNWSCGIPNNATTDAVIPSNAAVMPKLFSDITVKGLELQGPATLDLYTKKLTVAGAVTGLGTLSGSDLASLTLTGAAGTLKFTNGLQVLNNLTLNTGATATLGTAFGISPANGGGSLTVNAGATLTTGGNLTIRSNASGTASVANSAGTIVGNVTVERYIPYSGRRAWRLLSVPTGGTQTIKASWQEGQAALANGTPGYGVLLTGNAANAVANGYDFQTAGNSFLGFTNGSPGIWSPIAATTAPIATSSGYMVYMRGDRGAPITSSLIAQTATTLRTNGPLYQGSLATITLPAGQNVLVGNQYASAIDFANIVQTGLNAFKVWDPKLSGTSGVGAFQTFTSINNYDPTPGGGSFAGLSSNSRIESGQGFIVNAPGGGSIQLTEAAKVSGSRNGAFRNTTVYHQFKASLSAYTTGGLSLADGNTTVFDSAFSNAVDNDDVTKVNNFGENFAVLRDGTALAIEARKPIAVNDTVFFKLWNVKQQQYQLRFVSSNIDVPGLTAMLEDKFLNTATPVNTVDTTFVNFTITANTASAVQDRFRVVFKISSILPVRFTTVKATDKSGKVKVDWTVGAEQNIDHYEIEHSSNGREFGKLGSVKSLGNSTNQGYAFMDQKPFAGDNYYRVKAVESSGASVYSGVVKVSFNKLGPAFIVLSNPVLNNQINLQLINQLAGEYNVRLISMSGQTLFSRIISNDGGNSTKTIILPSQVSSGVYQLEIIGTDRKVKSVQKLVINN